VSSYRCGFTVGLGLLNRRGTALISFKPRDVMLLSGAAYKASEKCPAKECPFASYSGFP